jgi:hypothetical protein
VKPRQSNSHGRERTNNYNHHRAIARKTNGGGQASKQASKQASTVHVPQVQQEQAHIFKTDREGMQVQFADFGILHGHDRRGHGLS